VFLKINISHETMSEYDKNELTSKKTQADTTPEKPPPGRRVRRGAITSKQRARRNAVSVKDLDVLNTMNKKIKYMKITTEININMNNPYLPYWPTLRLDRFFTKLVLVKTQPSLGGVLDDKTFVIRIWHGTSTNVGVSELPETFNIDGDPTSLKSLKGIELSMFTDMFTHYGLDILKIITEFMIPMFNDMDIVLDPLELIYINGIFTQYKCNCELWWTNPDDKIRYKIAKKAQSYGIRKSFNKSAILNALTIGKIWALYQIEFYPSTFVKCMFFSIINYLKRYLDLIPGLTQTIEAVIEGFSDKLNKDKFDNYIPSINESESLNSQSDIAFGIPDVFEIYYFSVNLQIGPSNPEGEPIREFKTAVDTAICEASFKIKLFGIVFEKTIDFTYYVKTLINNLDQAINSIYDGGLVNEILKSFFWYTFEIDISGEIGRCELDQGAIDAGRRYVTIMVGNPAVEQKRCDLRYGYCEIHEGVDKCFPRKDIGSTCAFTDQCKTHHDPDHNRDLTCENNKCQGCTTLGVDSFECGTEFKVLFSDDTATAHTQMMLNARKFFTNRDIKNRILITKRTVEDNQTTYRIKYHEYKYKSKWYWRHEFTVLVDHDPGFSIPDGGLRATILPGPLRYNTITTFDGSVIQGNVKEPWEFGAWDNNRITFTTGSVAHKEDGNHQKVGAFFNPLDPDDIYSVRSRCVEHPEKENVKICDGFRWAGEECKSADGCDVKSCSSWANSDKIKTPKVTWESEDGSQRCGFEEDGHLNDWCSARRDPETHEKISGNNQFCNAETESGVKLFCNKKTPYQDSRCIIHPNASKLNIGETCTSNKECNSKFCLYNYIGKKQCTYGRKPYGAAADHIDECKGSNERDENNKIESGDESMANLSGVTLLWNTMMPVNAPDGVKTFCGKYYGHDCTGSSSDNPNCGKGAGKLGDYCGKDDHCLSGKCSWERPDGSNFYDHPGKCTYNQAAPRSRNIGAICVEDIDCKSLKCEAEITLNNFDTQSYFKKCQPGIVKEGHAIADDSVSWDVIAEECEGDLVGRWHKWGQKICAKSYNSHLRPGDRCGKDHTEDDCGPGLHCKDIGEVDEGPAGICQLKSYNGFQKSGEPCNTNKDCENWWCENNNGNIDASQGAVCGAKGCYYNGKHGSYCGKGCGCNSGLTCNGGGDASVKGTCGLSNTSGWQSRGEPCNTDTDCSTDWCENDGGHINASQGAVCGDCPSKTYNSPCGKSCKLCNAKPGLKCNISTGQTYGTCGNATNGKQKVGDHCNVDSDCENWWCLTSSTKTCASDGCSKAGMNGKYGDRCGKGCGCNSGLKCDGGNDINEKGTCVFANNSGGWLRPGHQGPGEPCNYYGDCENLQCIMSDELKEKIRTPGARTVWPAREGATCGNWWCGDSSYCCSKVPGGC